MRRVADDAAAAARAAPARRTRHEDGPPPLLRRHRLRRRLRRVWRSSPSSSSSISSTSCATSAARLHRRPRRRATRCCSRRAHLYELMPIAVLIGTIYALARLAQIVAVHDPAHRRPRPGPRALAAGQPGARVRRLHLRGRRLRRRRSASASPASCARASAAASSSDARAPGSRSIRSGPAASASYSINVGSAERGTLLRDVRIFEFDADGRLLTRTAAAAGVGRPRRHLDLQRRDADALDRGRRRVERARGEARRRCEWHSSLSPNVVAAAVLPVTTMSTARALALHRPPRRQRAGGAGAEDPVLESRPLSVRLPRDGRPGAAVRLPPRALRRRQHEGVRRHHARRQLRAPQQRLSPPRPARQLDAVDRRGDAGRASTSSLSLAAFSWLVRFR